MKTIHMHKLSAVMEIVPLSRADATSETTNPAACSRSACCMLGCPAIFSTSNSSNVTKGFSPSRQEPRI